MTTRTQRARFLRESIAVICKLMKNQGFSKVETERQVRNALKIGFDDAREQGRRTTPWISSISSLNGRWHLEKRFVDKDGNPRPLSWNGSRGSLLVLANKVVGKEKARGAITDLIRRRLLVRNRDGKWLPKASVLKPGGLDSSQSERTAAMVQRLLRTVAHNSKQSYKGENLLFEVVARVPRLPVRELAAFKRFTRTQGMIYARSVDEWLESRALPKSTSGTKHSREAGVVVFAYEEPSAQP